MEARQHHVYARLKPTAFRRAALLGGFWGETIRRSKSVGIPACHREFEDAGSLDNYRILTQGLKASHAGGPNNNEFVYKWMEACGYYLATPDSDTIKILLDEVADLVIGAQDNDGYVNTYYQHPDRATRGDIRFDSENRFEFYDFGHLAQAAIAVHRSSGERRLLDAALRFADLIVERFASPGHLPYRMNRGPLHLKREHPNHEIAMVELYRETGNTAYLGFAEQTLNEYLFWEQTSNEGHAVQETLLACAAVDLYLEIGDPKMLQTAERLWDDMYLKKMYITGGIGSRYVSESYGDAYELPNDRAYTETCAAISNVFWCFRMLLATGHVRYADTMERILYNGFLAGISLSGDAYLYQNPLLYRPGSSRLSPDADGQLQAESNRRWRWHNCPCCPPNMHRLFASLQDYIYTVDNDGIQVHLYTGSTVSADLGNGGHVALEQQTEYPWDGDVRFRIELPAQTRFTLSLRIPQWADGARVSINGEQSVGIDGSGFYHRIDRVWADGDAVELSLPLNARFEAGHPYTANYGRVAVCRGPLVYCLEQSDHSDVNIMDVFLSPEVRLVAEFEPDLLGGITTLTGIAFVQEPDRWRDAPYIACSRTEERNPRTCAIRMIPYYTWANRDDAAMCVWVPVTPTA